MTRALRGLTRVNRTIALLTMVGASGRPSYPLALSRNARGAGRYERLKRSRAAEVPDAAGGSERRRGSLDANRRPASKYVLGCARAAARERAPAAPRALFALRPHFFAGAPAPPPPAGRAGAAPPPPPAGAAGAAPAPPTLAFLSP